MRTRRTVRLDERSITVDGDVVRLDRLQPLAPIGEGANGVVLQLGIRTWTGLLL
jgi:hypothetical protein